MTFEDFGESLDSDAPPSGVAGVLEALWYDSKGDWDRAHQIVQDMSGAQPARVHAYLHRKEGDLSNARYWYNRAEKPEREATLEQEWQELVESFLG